MASSLRTFTGKVWPTTPGWRRQAPGMAGTWWIPSPHYVLIPNMGNYTKCQNISLYQSIPNVFKYHFEIKFSMGIYTFLLDHGMGCVIWTGDGMRKTSAIIGSIHFGYPIWSAEHKSANRTEVLPKLNLAIQVWGRPSIGRANLHFSGCDMVWPPQCRKHNFKFRVDST